MLRASKLLVLLFFFLNCWVQDLWFISGILWSLI